MVISTNIIHFIFSPYVQTRGKGNEFSDNLWFFDNEVLAPTWLGIDSLELSSTAEYAPQQFVGEHTTKAFRLLCYIPIMCGSELGKYYWHFIKLRSILAPTLFGIVILCEVSRSRSHHLGATQPLAGSRGIEPL